MRERAYRKYNMLAIVSSDSLLLIQYTPHTLTCGNALFEKVDCTRTDWTLGIKFSYQKRW